MKEDDFSKQLDHALDGLRRDSAADNLDNFEREVWAEIALRDDHRLPRLRRLLADGLPTISTTAATSVAISTVFLAVGMAFSRANTYVREVSHSMEERYVASIHPILRSESHAVEGVAHE
ncbi:hypothetical protein VSU19_22035 [Verrucomicrobiales bacterium BCK34]|nr:hypothetical protein [Verrucomicrobiales bacterium BCK34]